MLFAAVTVVAGAMNASALELVTNGGFENGPYTGTDWTYCTPTSWSGGSGIQSRYTTTFCAATPYGNYCNFRASWASLSQTLDFPVAGTYRLSFVYTARSGYTGQTTEIRLGSKVIKAYTSSSTSWATMSTDFIVTAPGPQTLAFVATSGGDSALDIVSCYLVTPAETVTDCASWRQMRAVLEAGYSARLTKDIMQDSNGNVLLNGSQKVSVDLNGHKITSSVNGRLFDLTSNSAKLTITDSLGGGVIDGTNFERTTASGGCVKLSSGCEFVFEGGTIQNFKNTGYNGGAIYNEGTTTISGGMITNCVAVSHNGGGVYNANGTFNMTGGAIVNCSAPLGGAIYQNSGTITMNDCVIEGCSATTTGDYSGGGAVALINGSFTMNGGTVRNNRSNKSAGAFYGVNGSTLVINGGTISGNYSPQCGGVFYGCSAITVNGGNFFGNTAKSDSVFSYSGSLVINGGVITNNVGTTRSMTINSCQNSGTKYMTYIYGGVIDGSIGYDVGANQGDCIWIYGGVFGTDPATTFSGRGLASLKNTKYTLANGKYLIAANAAGDDDDLFTGGSFTFCPTNELYAAAGLKVADYSAATGSGQNWTLKATKAIQVSDWETLKANLNAGNDVVVTKDIAITTQGQCLVVTDAIARDVTLDLNGHTIDAYNGSGTAGEKDRLFIWASTVKSTLTIIDSVGGGAFVGHKTVNGHSGAFAYVGYNCSIIVKGGAIRGFSTTGDGGAFYLANTASVDLDGGTIESCSASGNGGAARVTSGTIFTMNSGTITNCVPTSNGGAIYVTSGRFYMYGGTISGCSGVKGGAVYADGTASTETVRIYGGTIENCTASNAGGAIYQGAASDGYRIMIYGGTFRGNKAKYGGVIATSGGKHFDIYGGVFTGNSYTSGGYGAFFDDASANRLCYLYGGVWLDDYNPTAGLDDTSLTGGRTCAHVGSTYVIGIGVAYHATTKQLTGGTYGFCPTNAEYVAAGMVDPTTVTVTGSGTSYSLKPNGASASAVVELVTNGGFESGCVPSSSGYAYARDGGKANGWTLTPSGSAGITHSSDTTWVNSYLSGSSVAAFVQSGGTVQQTLTFPVPGTYRLTFSYAGRGNANCIPHYRAVTLDGVQLHDYGQWDYAWHDAAVDFVVSKAGAQTLSFVWDTSKASAGDPCSCIDNVSCYLLTPAAEVTECTSWQQVKAVLGAGGNAKLACNITQDSAQPGLNAAQNVTLDLNGYTIDRRTCSGSWWFMQVGAGATLTMTDSSAGQTGKVLSDVSKSHGANGNAFNITGKLIINGGTYEGMYTTGYGGCIYLSSGAELEMNGGTITGCKSGTNGGGAIYNNAGTFTMTGGMITNCTSAASGGGVLNNAAKMKMTGGKIVGNTSTTYGGGVFVMVNATMAFSGGEISYNTANGTTAGGGICSSGKVTMTGGSLIGNKAPNQTTATAFYSNCDDSDNIYGGVIEGTIYRAAAGDLYIYGGVYDTNPSSLCASGYSCTQAGTKFIVGKSVLADDANTLVSGEYTFCPTNAEYVAASVAVDTVNSTLEATTNATWVLTPNSGEVPTWSQMTLTYVSTEGGCFATDQNGDKLLDNNASTKWGSAFSGAGKQWVEFTAGAGVPERLELVTAGDTYIFVGRNWTGWTLQGWNGSAWTAIETQADQVLNTTPGASRTYTLSNDKAYSKYRIVVNATATGYGAGGQQMADLKLYTNTSRTREPVEVSTWAMLKANLEAGNSVKLAGDITQSRSAGDEAATPTGTTTVDLNGHTLYQVGLNRLFSGSGTKLTITDTSDAGTGAIVGDNSTGYSWGRVAHTSSGEIVLEKVTIKNFNGVWSNGSEVGKSGVFWLHGTDALLTMNSGTIQDCQGTCGAAVYVEIGAFTMNGGTITGCKATSNGGAIYNAGTVIMNDGTISGCSVTVGGGNYVYGGGAIYNTNTGMVTINGGTLEKNSVTSVTCGGVFFNLGKVTVNGGVIKNNSCGHCSSVHYTNGKGDGTFIVNGGEIAYNTGVYETFEGSIQIRGGYIHDNTNTTRGPYQFGSYSGSYFSGGVFGSYEQPPADKISSGYECKQIGSNYVVGKGVVASGTTLTEGLYTFCATNAEYVAAGVKVAATPVAQGTTPETWSIAEKQYCVCGDKTCPGSDAGDEHEIRTWYAWNSTSTLPTVAGNWYLTGDVNLTAQYSPVTGVTIDLAGHTIKQTATNARVINIGASVTFTLTDSVGGGKVTGGNLTGTQRDDGCGGGVYANANGATFIMYGGSICGNKTTTGPGIYAYSSSSVKVYGGFIENNTATEWGGGMCLSQGNHVFRNCVIRNNEATTQWGGAVRIDYGTVSFIDCVITNNAAAVWAGISANVGAAPVVSLGGTTVVRDNHIIGNEAQNNLGVESGYAYSVSTTDPLADGAEIGVTAANGAAIVTTPSDADYSQYFFADNAAYTVVNDANQVKLVATNGVVAVIGETQYSSLQYAFNSAEDGETIKLVKNTTENVTAVSYKGVTLDLNGFVLKAATSGTPALTLSESAGVILTNSDETTTHYFTVNANGLWTWNNDSSSEGAIAYETLTARPTTGQIIAIKGGCITGGSSVTRGGGVFQEIYGRTRFELAGGTIVGNSSSYGAIYQGKTSGTLFLQTGGRICGNLSSYGGAMFNDGGATLVIKGGDIAFNTGSTRAGAIYTYGELIVEGGRIAYCQSAAEGGAVCIQNNNCTMTMNGGEIVGNTASSHGGAVYIYAGNAFTMNGGVISNCTATTAGGAIHNAGTFTMNGGMISKCTSTGGGGAINLASGTVTISGGTIRDCSGDSGGVICAGESTVTITGGSFINNKATSGWGGFMLGYTLIVRGGYFEGHTATKDGGFYLGQNYVHLGQLFGGVFKGADPTTQSGGCLALQSGKAVTLVDSNYVVGESIAQIDSELSGGTYTFCPTNGEYVAGGLVVLAAAKVTEDAEATPPTWTLDCNYEITLDAQGGAGGTEGVTAQYGVAMPAITIPTRAGYGFGGYFTEKNGAGVQYYDATGASARTSDLAADTTLYAKWGVAGDPMGEAVGDGSIVMTSAKPYPWTIVKDVYHSGGSALKSGGYHVNYASSAVQTTVASAKKVSFWWRVSSEYYYDRVTFYVDNEYKAQIYGSTGWQQVSVDLSTTTEHVLKWVYTKDCSCSSGYDCAWLDDVVIERPFSGSGTAIDPWILESGATEDDVLRAGATYKAGGKYYKDADEATASGETPVEEIPLDDIMRAKGYVAISNGTYYRTFADAIAGCGGEPIRILDTTAKLPKFYKNVEGYLVPWDDADWEGVITDPMDLVTDTPADYNKGASSGVRVTLYGDDFLLGNNYIELGLRPGGAFGTRNYIPTSTGFHPNTYGRNSSNYLGLRATMTGWGDGSDPNGLLTRDFFTPGCIDEGWMITVGSAVKGAGRTGVMGDRSVTKVYTKTAADEYAGVRVDQRFTVSGNIQVDQTVAFGPDDTQYWTYITLKNTGSTDLANVNYYRAFDPDQPGNCNYSTDNYYHTDDDGGIWSIAFSYATGVATYANFDAIVGAGRYPFFFYVEPSDGSYTAKSVTQWVGWSNDTREFSCPANNYHRYQDTGMGVKFTFAKIAAGKSVTFRYLSSLDPNTDRAISAAKPIKLNGRYYTLAEAVLWVRNHGTDGQTFTVTDPKLTIEEVRLKFRTAGWDAEMTGTSGTDGTNRDFILKAIVKHWIKLNLNRGKLPADEAANPIEFLNTDGVITLPTPTKTNYDFAGWYLTEDFSGSPVTEIDATGRTEDVQVYARWVAGVAVDITLTPYLTTRGMTYSDPDMAGEVTFTVKLYGNNSDGRTFIGTATQAVTPQEEYGYNITNTIVVTCETGDYDSFTVETTSSRANYTSVSTDIESGAASAAFVFAPEEFQFKYSVRVADSTLKSKIIGLDALVVSPLNGTTWKTIQQLDYDGALIHSDVADGEAEGMYPVWSGKFDTYRYSIDVLGVYVEGNKYIAAEDFGDALTVTVEATEGCTTVGDRAGAYYDGAQVGKIEAVVKIDESSFYWAPAGTQVKLDGEYMTLAAATNAVMNDKAAYTGKTMLKVDTTITENELRESFAPTGLIPVRNDDGVYTLTTIAAKLVREHTDGTTHVSYFTAKEEVIAASVEEGDHIVITDTSKIKYADIKDAFSPFTVSETTTANDYIVRSLATAAVTVTLNPKDGDDLDVFAPTGVAFTVAFYGTYEGAESKLVKEKINEVSVKFSEEELASPYTISFTTNFTYGIGAYTALSAEVTVNRDNYTVSGGDVADDKATVAFQYHATVADYTYTVSMFEASVADAFRPTEIDLLITGEGVSVPVTLPLTEGYGVGTNRLAIADGYELTVKGYRLATGEYVAEPTDAIDPVVTLAGRDWTVQLTVNRSSDVWKPNTIELPKSDENDIFTNLTVKVSNPTPGTDDERTNMPVRVSRKWVEENIPDFTDGGTSKGDLGDRLSGNGDNGTPMWQSYILGLDPTNKISQVYADAPQDSNPDRVTLKTMNVKPVSGYKVQYRLDKRLKGSSAYNEGTPQTGADFELDVSGDDDPTGTYKVTMLLSEEGDETKSLKAETINTVGIVKATNTNKYCIIAVPWNKLAPGEVQDIAVSNVIKTANLEAGDKLHVYRHDKSLYDTWTLNADKTWGSVKTYKIGKDGKVTTDESGEAAITTIARGNGVWLEHANPTNAPYFLYGQHNETAPEVIVEKGHNLLAAPGITAWDLSNIEGATSSDKVLVPGAEPKVYTYKDGAWGYYKQIRTERKIGGVTKYGVKSVWTTTESTIPAGTGFWLINKSGEVEIK